MPETLAVRLVRAVLSLAEGFDRADSRLDHSPRCRWPPIAADGTFCGRGGGEWLDAEAAAAHLGLPARLVYAMVNAGQVPALRFPLRIRRQDLENCLERCRIRPGELAHLDPNATRRGGSREPALTARDTPDRRFGRRIDVVAAKSPPSPR